MNTLTKAICLLLSAILLGGCVEDNLSSEDYYSTGSYSNTHYYSSGYSSSAISPADYSYQKRHRHHRRPQQPSVGYSSTANQPSQPSNSVTVESNPSSGYSSSAQNPSAPSTVNIKPATSADSGYTSSDGKTEATTLAQPSGDADGYSSSTH